MNGASARFVGDQAQAPAIEPNPSIVEPLSNRHRQVSSLPLLPPTSPRKTTRNDSTVHGHLSSPFLQSPSPFSFLLLSLGHHRAALATTMCQPCPLLHHSFLPSFTLADSFVYFRLSFSGTPLPSRLPTLTSFPWRPATFPSLLATLADPRS